MKISELNKGVKGLELTGKIYISDKKSFEYKKFDWGHAQMIVVKDVKGSVVNPITNEKIELEEDSIIANLAHCPEITKAFLGKEILLHNCMVDSWEDTKDGKIVENKKVKCSKINVAGLEEEREEPAEYPDHVQEIAEIAQKASLKPKEPYKPYPYNLDGVMEVILRVEKAVKKLSEKIDKIKGVPEEPDEIPEGEEV